ncbi:unnamed protein product [Pedinophyceae sp. YPF-701]|nr:unnamed protein product [Pedinophyceae sp. YPF-701]
MMRVKKALPDASILKRRDYEAKLEKLARDEKEMKQKERMAHWEVRTGQRQQRTQHAMAAEEMQWQREEVLERRRQALKAKFEREEAQYKQEMWSLKESPEMRRERLARRARELGERRERSRQAMAEELLARAFRDSCDPLRDRDSHTKMMRAYTARVEQVAEAQAKEEARRAEEAAWAAQWEANRLEKEARYQRDKEEELERNRSQLGVLASQVAERVQLRDRDRDELDAERRAMHEEWARQEQAERDRIEALAEANRERIRDVLEFNAEKLARDAAIRQAEADEEERLLRDALAAERAAEAREKAEKERKRKETQAYRREIEEQMAQEAEDLREDELRAEAEAAAIRAKEDAARAKLEAARQALMSEVLAVRQDQVDEHLAEQRAAYEAKMAERQRLDAEMDELAAREGDARYRQQLSRLANRLDLEAQVNFKKERNALAAELEAAARAHAVKAEKEYLEMVEKVSKVEPNVWHGRRAHKWFS